MAFIGELNTPEEILDLLRDAGLPVQVLSGAFIAPNRSNVTMIQLNAKLIDMAPFICFNCHKKTNPYNHYQEVGWTIREIECPHCGAKEIRKRCSPKS